MSETTQRPTNWMRRGRHIEDLSDAEILALAIGNEEQASRAYTGFAEALRTDYPDTARMFTEMAEEETGHRHQLVALFKSKFGETIPNIDPADVRGLLQERPSGLAKFQGPEGMRRQARQMEANASRFYHQAASRTLDVTIRNVLGDLAVAEAAHERTADEIDETTPPTEGRVKEDDDARRRFVLQIIQPGLVGLMDGSVSTLAPVFAAAFATHNSWNAFLVGMAASVGAGVSMGFAEALADDGKLSGRGTPYLRGLVCGLMTIAGGIGHTLPYLIEDFWTATAVAGVVVVFELLAIAWIQWKYMDTPPVSAVAKVMLGGAIVLALGILIGSS
ncbi:MAG: iron exporter MbfA [Janthinobacterium lividum]